jgi:hypothetical protein
MSAAVGCGPLPFAPFSSSPFATCLRRLKWKGRRGRFLSLKTSGSFFIIYFKILGPFEIDLKISSRFLN